jgi:hypothetical protein
MLRIFIAHQEEHEIAVSSMAAPRLQYEMQSFRLYPHAVPAREVVVKALGKAAILALLNMVVFALAYVSFLRCDVR